MMGSQNAKSSQYRGVSRSQKSCYYDVQVNIKKVLEGMGESRGPINVGRYLSEKKSALVYDHTCRKYGVAEQELNFPRNRPVKEVRLFDDECYFCHKESPVDPVASPCNHVFCRRCILPQLATNQDCPCCQTRISGTKSLRSVDLIPWPKEEAAPTRKRRKTKDPGEGVDGGLVANNSGKNGAVQEDFSDYEGVTLQRAAKNHGESERASEEDDRKLPAKRKPNKTSKKRGPATTPKSTSKYSVGTRFIKVSRESSLVRAGNTKTKSSQFFLFSPEFSGHGKFEGRVVSTTDNHYIVEYPEDDDVEELSEYEFDDLEILTTNRLTSNSDDLEDTCDEDEDEDDRSTLALKRRLKKMKRPRTSV